MSIAFSGTLKRSGGVVSAINKQLKSITLKPAKKITVKFDPFHDNVTHTRNFLYYLSTTKILDTNLNCKIKTEVLSDRTDPTVEVTLVDGGSVLFKSANLTTLELFKLYNQHITPLAPVEEIAAPKLTKASRSKVATKKR